MQDNYEDEVLLEEGAEDNDYDENDISDEALQHIMRKPLVDPSRLFVNDNNIAYKKRVTDVYRRDHFVKTPIRPLERNDIELKFQFLTIECRGWKGIRMTGVDQNGHTYYARILNYTVPCYLFIPEDWQLKHINHFRTFIAEQPWAKSIDSMVLQSGREKLIEHYVYLQKFRVLEIRFKNQWDAAECNRFFRSNMVQMGKTQYEIKAEEGFIQPELHFFSDSKVRPKHWVKIPADKYRVIYANSQESTAEYEVELDWHDIHPCLKEEAPAPYAAALNITFDIEQVSHRPHTHHPDAMEDQDAIIQIAAVVGDVSTNNALSGACFILGSSNANDYSSYGVPVEEFHYRTEKELLIGFFTYWMLVKPHFSNTYNGYRYDWPTLFKRAQKLGVGGMITHLNLIKREDAPFQTFGNKFHPKPVGHIPIDACDVVKDDVTKRYDSYHLNDVAKAMFGDEKMDVPYSKIYPLHVSGPAGRHLLKKYCFHDTWLTHRILFDNRYMLQNLEKAGIMCTTPYSTFNEGSTSQNFAQLVERVHRRGWILDGVTDPKLRKKPKEAEVEEECDNASEQEDDDVEIEEEDGGSQSKNEHGKRERDVEKKSEGQPPKKKRARLRGQKKYKGGYVMDPKRGYHEMLAILDFTSQYPSAGRAWDLCWSTRIRDTSRENLQRIIDSGRKIIYKDLEDRVVRYENRINYGIPEWYDDKFVFFVVPEKADGEYEMSVFNEIETDMMSERKRVKDEQKLYTKAMAIYWILEACQQALKIICNSWYGSLGTEVFFPCPDMLIAACITASGRQCILAAHNMVKKLFGHENGESKYGDTDSIMAFLGTTDTQEAFRRAGMIQDELKKILPYPMLMEIEALYAPAIFFDPKSYAAVKWEMNKDGTLVKQEKLVVKGLEALKRSYPSFARKLLRAPLEIFLKRSDLSMEERKKLAVQNTFDGLMKLAAGEVPMQDLVTTTDFKGFGYYEESGSMPAHVQLASRLKQRDEQGAPRPGDRIPWVKKIVMPEQCISGTGNRRKIKSVKLTEGDRMETPEYMARLHEVIDTQYYLKMLWNPITKTFSVFDDVDCFDLYEIPQKIAKARDDFYIQRMQEELDADQERKEARMKLQTQLAAEQARVQADKIAERKRAKMGPGQMSMASFFKPHPEKEEEKPATHLKKDEEFSREHSLPTFTSDDRAKSCPLDLIIRTDARVSNKRKLQRMKAEEQARKTNCRRSAEMCFT